VDDAAVANVAEKIENTAVISAIARTRVLTITFWLIRRKPLPTVARKVSEAKSSAPLYRIPVRKTVVVIGALLSIIAAPAYAATSITASNGSILAVSKSTNVKSGDLINVTGAHFDETVGIYIAMCVVVPKTQQPTPCGGGADKTGKLGASYWISSNPPTYGVGLAKPYLPGGRFNVTLKVSPMIGKIDCRKTACAIYTRADHLRTQDRSSDMYIPLKFAK
jgi:hypothetical protein